MRTVSPLLSILLASLLAAGPVWGQTPAPVSATAPQELRIIHLQDHLPDADPGTSLSVRVTDEADAPVSGAKVVFRFPNGPGAGLFADGATSATVQTDTNGKASVNGVRLPPGASPAASIVATASKGAAHTGVLFTQTFSVASTGAVPVLAPKPQPLPAPVPVAVTSSAPRTPGLISVTGKSEAAPAALAEDDSPDANVPIRHMFGPDSAPAGVSVLNGRGYGESGGHGSKMKWILLVAAAAGGGAAFALLHKSSGSSSSSGVSIGSPSISVGHP